jgi:hypothetical protein
LYSLLTHEAINRIPFIKNKIMKRISLACLASFALIVSCKKESTPPEFLPTDKGSIEIEFDNVAGDEDLALNTGVYTNAVGETYSISKFNYYISNIILKNENGTDYVVPQDESYFLVQEEDEATHVVELEDVPAGNYTGITFTVGVDSAKCAAPVDERTGVLDPAAGGADMYWGWNSGYIFLKMEGTSPASMMGDFFYHIGGFGGYSSATINNIKTISLTIPGGAKGTVRTDVTPEMHLLIDAKKVLDGSTNVSIAANSMVMFTDYSVNIANNYANMFKIDHVHND